MPNTFAFISAIGIKSENRDIGDKLTAPELELSFLIMTDLDIQGKDLHTLKSDVFGSGKGSLVSCFPLCHLAQHMAGIH